MAEAENVEKRVADDWYNSLPIIAAGFNTDESAPIRHVEAKKFG